MPSVGTVLYREIARRCDDVLNQNDLKINSEFLKDGSNKISLRYSLGSWIKSTLSAGCTILLSLPPTLLHHIPLPHPLLHQRRVSSVEMGVVVTL